MAVRKVQVIPALDVTELDQAVQLVARVAASPHIYGYKLGFSLGLKYGLPRVVTALRELSDKPIIYDHQKAGTDIPDTGKLFAATLAEAGIGEGILFPQAGPHTLRAWATALKEAGLEVIVGGAMTHPGYLESEGGFIRDAAATEIYRLAHELGVRRFVMPLTKPELCKKLWDAAGLGEDCTLYSPGYGAQKGQLGPFAWVPTHHIIVGRGLLHAEDPLAYLDALIREAGETA